MTQCMCVQTSDSAAEDIQLTAVLCHELSHPLTYLLTHIGTVRARLERPVHEDDLSLSSVKELIEAAYVCGEHMAGVLRDIRTQVRGETTDASTFELIPVIGEAITAVGSTDAGPAIELEYTATPRITGSRARLAQVFLNLLVNALSSFDDPASKRNEITVTVSRAGGEFVAIDVTDTGRGIPPDRLDRPGAPIVSDASNPRSMGLGLFICRRIVAAHNGLLTIESQPGQGTRVRILLPCEHELDF